MGKQGKTWETIGKQEKTDENMKTQRKTRENRGKDRKTVENMIYYVQSGGQFTGRIKKLVSILSLHCIRSFRSG